MAFRVSALLYSYVLRIRGCSGGGFGVSIEDSGVQSTYVFQTFNVGDVDFSGFKVQHVGVWISRGKTNFVWGRSCFSKVPKTDVRGIKALSFGASSCILWVSGEARSGSGALGGSYRYFSEFGSGLGSFS